MESDLRDFVQKIFVNGYELSGVARKVLDDEMQSMVGENSTQTQKGFLVRNKWTSIIQLLPMGEMHKEEKWLLHELIEAKENCEVAT